MKGKEMDKLEEDIGQIQNDVEKRLGKIQRTIERMRNDSIKDLKSGDYIWIEGSIYKLESRNNDKLYCTRPHHIRYFDCKTTEKQYKKYWGI